MAAITCVAKGRPKKDLTGMKFGRLTVLRYVSSDAYYNTRWECSCACGNKTVVQGGALRTGKILRCKKCADQSRQGHLKHLALLKNGSVIGKWQVLGEPTRYKNTTQFHVRCRCECGKVRNVHVQSLTRGTSKGCTSCVSHASTEKSRENKKREQTKFLASYKAGAKNRGFGFDITDSYALALAEQNCHYCKSPPLPRMQGWGAVNAKRKRKGKKELQNLKEPPWYANGIDRRDSSKGYVEGNCVPCCEMCNRMKLDYTEEEWKARMRKVLNVDGWTLIPPGTTKLTPREMDSRKEENEDVMFA